VYFGKLAPRADSGYVSVAGDPGPYTQFITVLPRRIDFVKMGKPALPGKYGETLT
jgi:hypothetical protein